MVLTEVLPTFMNNKLNNTQLNNLKDNVFVAFTPILQTFTNQLSGAFKDTVKEFGGVEKIGETFAKTFFDSITEVLLLLQSFLKIFLPS